MKKTKIILSAILFISIMNSAACLSGDKYYTYQLETKHKQHNFQSGNDYIMEVSGKIFKFFICHNISIHNGTAYSAELHGSDKYIYTGPYDLVMSFYTNNDTRYDSTKAEKIIVKKMLLQSKDNIIDLHEKVTVSFGGKQLDKKELANFKNAGEIDLTKSSYDGREIRFIYEDIDIAFNHDKSFTIEYDIDLKFKYDTLNYAFATTFNRATITDRMTIGTRVKGTVNSCGLVCVYGCADPRSCLKFFLEFMPWNWDWDD